MRKRYGIKNQRIKNGITLLEVFLIPIVSDIAWLFFLIYGNHVSLKDIIINSVIVAVQLFILFWSGIIRTYIFSKQLGIKWRIIGIVYGLITVANIIALTKIIRIADYEYKTETKKDELNNSCNEQEICKTKYQILFVHGVFFRNFRFFNYWRRIPEELKKTEEKYIMVISSQQRLFRSVVGKLLNVLKPLLKKMAVKRFIIRV